MTYRNQPIPSVIEERRFRLASPQQWCGGEILAALLGLSRVIDLPDDVFCHRFSFDHVMDEWVLLLGSATFEPVASGTPIPRMPLVCLREVSE